MKSLQRWLLVCVLFLALSGCSLASCSDDPACTRVLFIGNSYTYVNDLPGTLTQLANSGGKRIETGMAAQGGWSLNDHLNSAETLDQIQSSKWNFVVLQEQSMIPASDQARDAQMVPAARSLSAKIKAAGAQTILFVTWAHNTGWPENGMSTYEAMQRAIDNSYLALGQQLHAPLAPVGYAWFTLRQQNPQLNLWQGDGIHPNEQGTYLAACVFYAVLFHTSPEGLSYRGNLSGENAALLQKTAAETVFDNLKKWNLP
jgi:hypothetical protein